MNAAAQRRSADKRVQLGPHEDVLVGERAILDRD
jgi:hypothetical protein